MSGTAFEHPQVREYLRELGAAMRDLPDEQSSELREQISAHLDEVLGPDTDDKAVADALRRLGSPADLAAEARASRPAAPVTGGTPGSLPALLLHVRKRTWIIVAVAALVVATGVATAGRIADVYTSAGSLSFVSGADWWYPQDVRHQVITTAGETTQNTTPIRSGQLQGYVVSIYNPTHVTQTIVGDASGPHRGWDNPGGPNFQIAVSRSNRHIASGFAGESVAAGMKFSLPVSIPPQQSRLVRLLWTSAVCLSKGESGGIDQLYLRVRVGWFTRTEVIPQQNWYLIGPSSQPCK